MNIKQLKYYYIIWFNIDNEDNKWNTNVFDPLLKTFSSILPGIYRRKEEIDLNIWIHGLLIFGIEDKNTKNFQGTWHIYHKNI